MAGRGVADLFFHSVPVVAVRRETCAVDSQQSVSAAPYSRELGPWESSAPSKPSLPPLLEAPGAGPAGGSTAPAFPALKVAVAQPAQTIMRGQPATLLLLVLAASRVSGRPAETGGASAAKSDHTAREETLSTTFKGGTKDSGGLAFPNVWNAPRLQRHSPL
ncbi:hypothetical protein MTO96_017802 [Rhipicephalus appendiculatus]